jgi:hypothetical protein
MVDWRDDFNDFLSSGSQGAGAAKGVAASLNSTQATMTGNLGLPGRAANPVVPIIKERLKVRLRPMELCLRMRSGGAADH